MRKKLFFSTESLGFGYFVIALSALLVLPCHLFAANSATGLGAFIGGGDQNTASDTFCSILGGFNNTASAPNANILGGHTNFVNGQRAAILTGFQNTITAAGEQGAIISGSSNVVNGSSAGVCFGFMNTATGSSSVILTGRENLVTGTRSAILSGKRSTFLANDSLFFGSDINYSGADTGVVYIADDSRGGVTLNQNFSSNEMICRFNSGFRFYADSTNGNYNFRLKPNDTSESNSDPTRHVAHIKSNLAANSSVLALQVGDNNPSTADNMATFFNNAGGTMGAIECVNSTTVAYTTTGSDFAEALPVADSTQAQNPAEIVPVHAGEIGNWANADHFMVISNQAGFVGNDPGEESEGTEKSHQRVAFLGQVPVKVHGTVDAGDYIIASDKNDGTGIAKPAEKISVAEMHRVVGRAWESSSEESLKKVNTGVGLDQTTLIVPTLERLERENAELRERLAELEARDKVREARFARLEAAIKASSSRPIHSSFDLTASKR